MKKVCLLFTVLFFSFNAYSFWIWSPKTQEWKNPKYSPLATPKLQLESAVDLFDDEKVKEALPAFRKLIVHYPDSKEAAEAQYYIGRCYDALGKYYHAFLEYFKVIDRYPNSERINEIVERSYAIGEYFLERDERKWLGISMYDFIEHPSIEIFRRIVDSVYYSEIAVKAQYKLGVLFKALGRNNDAREAFQKLVDNYPDSDWSKGARYQLALVSADASLSGEYDQTMTIEAKRRLKDFIEEYPEADVSQNAVEQIEILREREAKSNFDSAVFYEKQGRKESAKIYYEIVIREYPESSLAGEARKRLERIKR